VRANSNVLSVICVNCVVVNSAASVIELSISDVCLAEAQVTKYMYVLDESIFRPVHVTGYIRCGMGYFGYKGPKFPSHKLSTMVMTTLEFGESKSQPPGASRLLSGMMSSGINLQHTFAMAQIALRGLSRAFHESALCGFLSRE
jgi:hypothetical protein